MRKILDLSITEVEQLVRTMCDSHLKLHGFQGHSHVAQLLAQIQEWSDPKPEEPAV